MTKAILGRLRQRRGIRAWVYILGIAVFSAAGWLRMVDTVTDWYWLDQVAAVSPGPMYLAATGALWGIAALLAIVWVFLRLPRWRMVGLAAAVFLAATYWADRLLLTRAEYGFFNVGFSALLTILGLLIALLMLWPFESEKYDGIERSGS